MAIRKEYSQNKDECKVTFLLVKDFASNFNEICVIGDFNNWSHEINLFSESEADGSYSATLFLSANNSYHFRYLGDGVHWFNEPEADGEVESYFKGFNNSVITV